MLLVCAIYFVLAGATLSLLIWSGSELLRGAEDPLTDRLEELRTAAMVTASRTPRRGRNGGGIANGFIYAVGLIPGCDGWVRETEKRLQQAGIRKRAGLALYLLFHMLFMAAALAGMAWLQRGNDPFQMLGGMVAAFLIGFLLPGQVLHWLVRRYRRRLQDALPDTVDLLGITLGTGLALDQAMARVAEELEYIYPELANEFATVVMQVRAGQERTVAFQHFVRRTGIEDIKSLSAMIVQSEKFGTSLANALKVYADALRTRRRLRAEAAVGKAGIKMLFPIVLFILPALLIVTVIPGLLSVLHDLRVLGGGR
jgi:tight adherence protein C